MKRLPLVVMAASLAACSTPPHIDAANTCFLHYTPMPVNPFDASGGDLRVPDHHCLLQLPLEIARGGDMVIAPEAFAAAAKWRAE